MLSRPSKPTSSYPWVTRAVIYLILFGMACVLVYWLYLLVEHFILKPSRANTITTLHPDGHGPHDKRTTFSITVDAYDPTAKTQQWHLSPPVPPMTLFQFAIKYTMHLRTERNIMSVSCTPALKMPDTRAEWTVYLSADAKQLSLSNLPPSNGGLIRHESVGAPSWRQSFSVTCIQDHVHDKTIFQVTPIPLFLGALDITVEAILSPPSSDNRQTLLFSHLAFPLAATSASSPWQWTFVQSPSSSSSSWSLTLAPLPVFA